MAKAVKKPSKSQSKKPLVSVVMSVYNGEKYLREAIDSILNQTFTDFEFIIINDGSTDGTLKIIKSYKDPRIVLISRENKGLVASLNEGIKKAQGKYIARMDADDISLPTRLEKQTKYMEAHLECVMVGAGITFIDDKGKETGRSPLLLHHDDIKLEILVRCPVAHPVVFFRRITFKNTGGYRQSYFPAEDYDLWLRFMEQGRLANLGEILLEYRELNSGISSKQAFEQKSMSDQIRLRALSNFSFDDLKTYKSLAKKYDTDTPDCKTMLARLAGVYIELAWQNLQQMKLVTAFRVFFALGGSIQGSIAILKWIKGKVLV